ncbi:MAG: hypothetical protein IPP68_07450 [Elusimicrobia bacterium]|nr:hypothetical protein [Elusimicrobiota bacterium]
MDELSPTQSPTNALPSQETLVKRIRSGASWFVWIALLSAINSIATMLGSAYNFVIGLGITRANDALAITRQSHLGPLSTDLFALIVDGIFIGMFLFFGKVARTGKLWPFIVGMVIYVLDSSVVIQTKDFMLLPIKAGVLLRE